MIAEKRIVPQQPLAQNEINLLACVDSYKDQLIDLIQKMVQIDSVNISEDLYCDRSHIFDFVEQYMQEKGFHTMRYDAPFPQHVNGEKVSYPNLIIKYEEDQKGKRLQFCGHLDTVPYNPEKWNNETPPTSGKIIGSRLYGRGTMDMKVWCGVSNDGSTNSQRRAH